jgi:hypothetical protein
MLILKSLIIVSSALSSNDNLFVDQIFERFTRAFKDESTVQNWMKSTKRESIPEPLLFKEIIKIIGEVISVLNTEKYTNVRSLFLKTNMTVENIGYPYLVTFNILTSIKRIISMYDGLKTTANVLSFSEKTLYYEYDQIYKIHELAIVEVWHKIHFVAIPPNLLSASASKNDDSSCTKHCISIMQFYALTNNMLISLLPTNYQTPVYVVTNSKGLQTSRWCTEHSFHCYIREKSKMVCSPMVLLNLSKHTIEKSVKKHINIKEFMIQPFICDKTIAKLLIMIFHYYSDVTSKNTEIEITKENEDEYKIEWSFSKKPSICQIKKYWMRQEIEDLSNRKIISEFSSRGTNRSEYSTIKSIQTPNEPIKTRLILLSCGHQLGFGSINKFFRKYYIKYRKPLECLVCKTEIVIVGSYASVVYKYKQETSSCKIC